MNIKNKITSKIKRTKAAYFSVLSVLLMSPFSVMAATNCSSEKGISKLSCNIQAQLNSIGDLAVNIFYLGGLVLFGTGLWLINKEQKMPGQEFAKKGMVSMLVGAGLVIVTFLLDQFATSIKGEEVKSDDYVIGKGDI